MSLFLHLDTKSTVRKETIYTPREAELSLVSSMNIRWGHVSLIECTLKMMTCALDSEWDYCHYITESDLPLKTMDEIDCVFTKYAGKEFIDFAPGNYKFAHYKCDVYHFFPCFTRYRNSRFLKALNHGCARFQWRLGYRRRNLDYLHGSAYFSVTRDFAAYIIDRADKISQQYAYTLAADEVWLQTLCRDSQYFMSVHEFEKPYIGNLRFIDWGRREGNSPHTFVDEDYDDLIDKGNNTELCFARKFMEDSVVAERLKQYLLTKAGKL